MKSMGVSRRLPVLRPTVTSVSRGMPRKRGVRRPPLARMACAWARPRNEENPGATRTSLLLNDVKRLKSRHAKPARASKRKPPEGGFLKWPHQDGQGYVP